MLVLAVALGSAQAQRRPVLPVPSGGAVARSAGSDSSISISLVPVNGGLLVPGGSTAQGMLQLGKVSAGTGAQNAGVVVERHLRAMVVRTEIGIRLDSHLTSNRPATLSAFLLNPDSRCSVLLDGVKLGPTPRLIQSGIRYGVVNQHRIEVEVPYTVTEAQGNLARNLGFVATSD
jgi:hypothetical protein